MNELLAQKTNSDIEGDISLANMVVIARNRFVFLELEKVLVEKGIPYSLKKSERQEEPSSIFGKVLDLAIRIRLNPKDWIDGKKLCAALKIAVPTTAWGNDNLLLEMANAARQSAILFPDIQALNIEQPNIPKLYDHFNPIIKNLRDAHLSKEENELELELERSLQELDDFRNSWTTFKMKGLGKSLISFRNAIAIGQVSENYGSAGLTLSTAHNMKGLEEELNSAFVAITRAKRWIFVTCPLQRVMPWGSAKSQTVSRFVKMLQT